MSEKQNLGKVERIVSATGGALLAIYGVSRRSWAGGALAIAGAALMERGLEGRCRLKASLEGSGPVTIHKTITIASKSPEEVYGLWRDFSNLPQHAAYLESVKPIDDRRSHWVARGPAGARVEWDAEIVNERAGKLIEWRSLPGSDLDIAGIVRFKRKQGGGTKVHLTTTYTTPGGAIGETIGRLLRQDPEKKIVAGLESLREAAERA